ncbi:hypothetical protein E2C01_061292 [Portunus trituberculatus]|uniref:Uncharacterized protein n=1 Tax=Portunus trituberculatus TaxID=210409 RepID=A0A5B7HAX0_PORTR|nr:hypothetical protein [Portunus trituberculatus]
MHICTSSAAVPSPTTIPGSSTPPSISVSQAARSHSGRSADMEITHYRHSEIGSLQTTCCADLGHWAHQLMS